jgi:hypothetical protein
MRSSQQLIPVEAIAGKTFLIRGQKVMLSTHLAELYGVAPRVLVQEVKRNRERFPEDFMFQLMPGEFKNLKSQFATSRAECRLSRELTAPTDVAMLVLDVGNSDFQN